MTRRYTYSIVFTFASIKLIEVLIHTPIHISKVDVKKLQRFYVNLYLHVWRETKIKNALNVKFFMRPLPNNVMILILEYSVRIRYLC